MESGVSGGEGVQAIHNDVVLPPAESWGICDCGDILSGT